jgi:hypothetical protein
MLKQMSCLAAIALLSTAAARAEDLSGAICTSGGCSALPPAVAAAVILEGLFERNIEQNFAAAGDESGAIAQAIRAATGVSLGDIERYGIAGGPNSEVNKLGRFFASVFGW